MASESPLPHPFTDSDTSTPQQNGHISPPSDDVTTTSKFHHSAESQLSDVEPPSRHSDVHSEEPIQTSTTPSRSSGSPLTDTASDQDAEGEEDGEYGIETPSITAVAAPATKLSPPRSPARAAKRKLSIAEDEYMRENPELYGLRRSGRARPSRRVVESSSEEESDEPHRKKRKNDAQQKSSARATPAQESLQESDSDSDIYAASRRRALASEKRKRSQIDDTLAPPPKRFSERRTAKVANYNEDDGLSDDDEMATPNNWAWGADETTPGIDIVMNARLKQDIEDKEIPTKYDYEYWIKWQDQAHYHSTWETWDTLSQYKGYRRLENFWRNFRDWQARLNDPGFPAEDKEQYCIEREDRLDHFHNCMHIDRVIGAKDGEDETEYLVLWKGCEYKDSTWETASLVSELAQTEIDRYLDRTSQLPVTNQNELKLRTRSPYHQFREQPSYVKHGQLRDFQISGVNFLAFQWCRNDNIILADEMGLGKTVQTVSFINWLRHDRGQQGPFLIVIPLSTLPAWADTFDKWAPDINYIKYVGAPASRSIIQEKELFASNRKYKFHVLLTTYEYVIKDPTFLGSIKWQFLAVDEAHRLKNRKSELYAILMNFNIPSRLLITGTPMQNNLPELASLMNFLKPGQGDVADELDLNTETAAQKLAELQAAIDPLIIRRTKSKVEKDLPPKSEKIIRVALSDYQLEYYKNILAKNYAALNQGGNGQKASLLNITMELKKCSNHAFMLPIAEQRRMEGVDRNDRKEVLKTLITCSGKMMILEKLLTKLKAEGHRVLIFSQMVNMLNILGEYCVLKGEKFQRLDGTVAAGPRAQAIEHFNSPDSQDFIFLLSTRAGGLGINLTAADTIIIFDSDWNPQADLQAMARAHRIGQTRPVQVYRLVSKDTLEEDILERARNKMILEYLTIQKGVTDKASKDLSDLGDRLAQRVGEPNSIEDINRLLKRRGQRMFEQTGNQKELEAMDIDAVIAGAEEHKTEQPESLGTGGGEDFLKSFEYTDVKADLEWDDIIPEEQIKQLKEQERKEEEERMTQELLKQAEPRKRKAPTDANGAREQRAAKKQARAAAAADDDESDGESEADLDPKRPLSEHEARNLIRAYEKYGTIDDCRADFLRDAKLQSRDIDVLKATLDEVKRKADEEMRKADNHLKARERETNKPLTKKEKKAPLFDYRGVKRLNAETIINRPIEMRMMRDVVKTAPDWRNFRVPEASKGAQYDCPWGAREDGMLCVGIARYGYGAWVAIRDDPELGMGDKFFLEEHRVDKKAEREGNEDKHAKSPGAVHLVRRANYLIQVLKDKTSGGTNIAVKKALENHHRNNRKHPSLHKHRSEKSVTASPGPSVMRKISSSDQIRRPRGPSHSESRQHVFHGSIDRKGTPDRKPNGHAGTPDRKRKAEDEPEDSRKPKPKHARSDEQLNAIKIQKHSHAMKKERSSEGHTHPAAEMLKRKPKDVYEVRRTSGDVTSTKPITDQARLCHQFRERSDNYQKLKDLKATTQQKFPGAEFGKRLVPAIIDVGLAIVEEAKKAKSSSDMMYWDYVAKRYWPNPQANLDGQKLRVQFEKYNAKRLQRDNGGAGTPVKTADGAPSKSANGTHMNGGSSSNGNPNKAMKDGVKIKPEQ